MRVVVVDYMCLLTGCDIVLSCIGFGWTGGAKSVGNSIFTLRSYLRGWHDVKCKNESWESVFT